MNARKTCAPIGLTLLAGLFAVCSSPATAAVSFADPFAYCAAVGSVDAPDARWTGPRVPDAVLNGIVKAMNIAPDMPRELLAQSTFWRCMNGRIYVCTVGANIPCQEKADTSQIPRAEMTDYCSANPNSDFIPTAVTGRATVYGWRCANGTAEIVRELTRPDARGFLSMAWHEVAQPPAAPSVGMANPASVHCVQHGGKLEIRKDSSGGEVGFCVFPDKSECEEWAFQRGECRP
jgi:putative hemolysin